jgi:hypothetical protein
MKPIIALLVLLISIQSYADLIEVNCSDLARMLMMEKVQQIFRICESKLEPLVILDKHNILNDCKNYSICGRPLQINEPDSFLKTVDYTYGLSTRYPWLDLVYTTGQKENRTFIALFGSKSNQLIVVEITGSRDNPHYTITSTGVF